MAYAITSIRTRKGKPVTMYHAESLNYYEWTPDQTCARRWLTRQEAEARKADLLGRSLRIVEVPDRRFLLPH